MSGLRDFLNDYFNPRHIAREKRKFRKMQERVKALPEEYRYVYDKIQGYMFQGYMWHYSGGSGMDLMLILADLLDLFETGVAEGKRVLEITGEDVAGFCDDLLRNARMNTEDQGEALNRDIMKKLGKGKARK
jgi:DNA-binding ferritin-like protein (Dps family)